MFNIRQGHVKSFDKNVNYVGYEKLKDWISKSGKIPHMFEHKMSSNIIFPEAKRTLTNGIYIYDEIFQVASTNQLLIQVKFVFMRP